MRMVRAPRRLSPFVLVVLVAAGCGNGDDETAGARRTEPPAAGAPAPEDSAEAPAPEDSGAAAPAGQDGGDAGGSTDPARRAGPTRASGAAPDRPASPAAPGPAGEPGPSAASGAPAEEAGSPSPGGRGDAEDATPDAPVPAPVPRPSNGKPIIVGNVGTYTGPAGGSLKNLPEGVQVWVKWIKDRGGIAGHDVRLIVVDDGGDPARHRAAVQDLVENKKVIAFLANGEAISGESSVEYLTAKKIPVIGNEGGSDWFYSSPVYFAPFPTGDTYWRSFIHPLAETAIPQGKTKFGSLACVEAVTCEQAARIWHDQGVAAKAGFEPTYRASISLAQPDFTAECLAAQRAGAQVIAITADDSTVSRIARSCGRQNYRPIFAWVVSATKIRQVEEEYLNNGVIVLNYFPWLKTDTPATAEFHAAMKQHYKGDVQPPHAGGWVSSKVFEAAARRTDRPEEAAGILEGLYSFREETIDGLTGPLTFTAGQNSPRRQCWAGLVIRDKKWLLMGDGSITCKN